MIASSVFFSLSAVLVKSVSGSFNSYFVSVIRFVIGIVLGMAILIITKKSFQVSDKKAWVIRGIAGSISMILFYLAIDMTSSARATLMNNLYVIFVALFGYLLNKEYVKAVNIISMVICLTGVTIIFYDGGKYSLAGDAIGVLSGLIMGIAVHYTKRSSEKEHPVVVYMSACIFGLAFAPLSSVYHPNPGLSQIILLIGIGVSSFLAQWLMTSSYSRISAIKGSLISYLKIPFTVVIGITLGDRVSTKFYIGTGILIIGLLIESGSPQYFTLKIMNNLRFHS
jgi:drug/metabolite transporter (DMT)-like permease